jgi:hypothetical protein
VKFALPPSEIARDFSGMFGRKATLTAREEPRQNSQHEAKRSVALPAIVKELGT